MSMNVKLSKVWVDDETKKAVLDVINSGWFVLGEQLKKFEEKFAAYIGTKYAVGLNSGTAAIHATLVALGIQNGDEVIVPAHTAFPTVEPILWCNAKPIFADIEEKTYNIDPNSVRKMITNKTKLVLPVDLYGHPSKKDELLQLCDDHNIPLVEDCCQAHGAKFNNAKVGSLGIAGCFSFYPSKNMTVYGDGGMVTTDNEAIYKELLLIRHHGSKDRYHHITLGHTFRLGEISAAVGLKQLKKLDYFNDMRRKKAKIYHDLLEDAQIILPSESEWAYHVYHLYVIRVKKRDLLLNYLHKHHIDAAIHYPIPCHQQPAMSMTNNVSLPNTEKIVKEILTLPMHPQLTQEEMIYVANNVKAFLH